MRILEHDKLRLLKRPNGTNAFTLIELMVVIAILGILIGIAVPSFATYRERAMVAVCITDIGTIGKDITAFAIDNDRLSDTLAEVDLFSTLPRDERSGLEIDATMGSGGISGQIDFRPFFHWSF